MDAIKKENVDIRPMERRDIFPVLAMLKKMSGAQGILTHRDLVNSDLGGALDLSFVAEIDGQVGGLLLGRFAFLGIPVAQVGIMQVLAVDPDYQRRGIAASLVNAVLDRCYAEGVGTVRGFFEERNWEVKIFLENMGFKPSGLIEYTKTIEV